MREGSSRPAETGKTAAREADTPKERVPGIGKRDVPARAVQFHVLPSGDSRVELDLGEPAGVIHQVAPERVGPNARGPQELRRRECTSRHDDRAGGDLLDRTVWPMLEN